MLFLYCTRITLKKKDAPATMTKIDLYVNNSKIDWHISTYVLYGWLYQRTQAYVTNQSFDGVGVSTQLGVVRKDFLRTLDDVIQSSSKINQNIHYSPWADTLDENFVSTFTVNRIIFAMCLTRLVFRGVVELRFSFQKKKKVLWTTNSWTIACAIFLKSHFLIGVEMDAIKSSQKTKKY